MSMPGIGPVMAARLIARTGNLDRFPTAAAYANYCGGTAPIEIAGADKARHRLSRKGDRRLNSAPHTLAVIQIRMPAAQDAPTTARRSPKARARRKPNAASNAAWPTTSGA